MIGQPMVEVTEADIQSVADKLGRFSATLTPGEQMVVSWLLQRAASAEEVQGYALPALQASEIQAAVLDALGFAVPR